MGLRGFTGNWFSEEMHSEEKLGLGDVRLETDVLEEKRFGKYQCIGNLNWDF